MRDVSTCILFRYMYSKKIKPRGVGVEYGGCEGCVHMNSI